MPLTEPRPPFPGWPRYVPERPLPPYRYVPGLNPHPIRDPAGHSHGRHETPSERTFPWGADLHNAAYWWEAHEAWEGLWQLTDKRGEQAQFLQGLIQVSAALLKRHLGSPEGSEVLFGEAVGRLAPIAQAHPQHMGLDLPDYLRQVAACRAGGPPPMIRLL